MASASSGDPAAVQRFRLLRTADCCRITTRALATGDIDDRIAEVQEAVRSAEALAAGPWRRPPSA
jgi:hypothetical protein